MKHLLLALALAASTSFADPRQAPSWVWSGAGGSDQELTLRRTFQLDRAVEEASLVGTCDNHMTVLLNGAKVLSHGSWESVAAAEVARHLRQGENLLEVRARNAGGPAGLALRLELGEGQYVVTDGAWEAVTGEASAPVTVLGRVGAPDLPWSGSVSLASFDGAAPQPDAGAPQPVRAGADVNLPEGFVADLLYTVPRDQQGSWVSITTDPKGRLYVSDQGGKGLYRVTPAAIGVAGATTSVEAVDVGVTGGQGMVWAFDSLYVNVNGQGLWRIRDTDGDDQLDDAQHLIKLGNGGEHGPHAVILTEDGTGLYFLGGNHTDLPKFDGSQAPSNWDEDLLLPRQWDARGHARGKLAPGGWIARCEPDGTNVQVLSNGYRNQYDIALNTAGEMFTYDADMEWDHGAPWYRPTRVCLATSGSEFGWRSGTGKWPTYYEDSLPSVVDIGPGSPTGIVFGTGARFPERYQRALFILDWTFGTIYAIHLEPDGAGYTGSKEHFAWAKPLAVTDAIVGHDGALYFAVGGRNSQSHLYRIRYEGAESTAPAQPDLAGAEARRVRHALENFHGAAHSGAVEAAWEHLSSDDRYIRFAARIAVENQPVAEWRERALSEREPRAAAAALVALARQGAAEDLPASLAALARHDLRDLPEDQQLPFLRAYALAFVRLGAPDDAQRAAATLALDPLLPSPSAHVNAELVRLLTYLQSPTVAPKTMALIAAAPPEPAPAWADLTTRNDRYGGPIAAMLADMPPVRRLNLAFLLRSATKGWTPQLRRSYFEFFVDAADHPGGASYAGFLTNMRNDAAVNLPPEEERTLAALLGRSLVAPPPENVTPPEGPGRTWTASDAVAAASKLRGRSFDKGKNLFHATTCSACHRFAGEGGAIGPDLTTVANKYSMADLIESIIEPSKTISDQYASKLVADHDGLVAEGLVVEEDGEVRVYGTDPNAEPTVFARADVAVIRPSALSQMPQALLDSLNEEELKDLLAYLVSGGDKKAAVFRGGGR